MRSLIPSLRTFFRRIAVPPPPVRRTMTALCALVARLPDDTRRVVTLRKVYDFPVPEIAARLALTPAQVEHHLVTAALAIAGCIDCSDFVAAPSRGDAGEPT